MSKIFEHLWQIAEGFPFAGPMHERVGSGEAKDLRYHQYSRKFLRDKEAGQELIPVERHRQNCSFNQSLNRKYFLPQN